MGNQFVDYITCRDAKRIREYRTDFDGLMDIVSDREYPNDVELEEIGRESKAFNKMLNNLHIHNPTFSSRVLLPLTGTTFTSLLAGLFYMADDGSLLQIGGIGLCGLGIGYLAKGVIDDIKYFKWQESDQTHQKAVEEYRKGNIERALEIFDEDMIDEEVEKFWGR